MDSILITGAASGIGLATARRFHTNGWRVGLLDVNEGALQAVHAELGERCWYRRLDVTDMGQCEAAVAAFAESAGGRLDVLFNSAGVLRMGHFEDLSAEQHRFTLDVNVAGTLQMCLAALPYLKQSRSPRVLNMSSASALYGVPHLASYSASKFAVRGLTEALDLEWRRHGIRVQDLMPPFVNTGMVNKQAFEAPVVRRMGVKLSADDVARAAFDTLQGDPRVHVPVGLPFRFTVLLEKVMPQRATRALMAWLSRD
ncbi:SDR family oxidoreductase [Alloalcanivorax venustensis]|jgi:NAD(P)-dependent dehydrogenase (short-subunit alcohol dehydrogenase family)|uniref:SDR family oxidoreductase n=1 Tax=Alloalcanivorax venustensis TaxID=172371 RepID=UPI000E9F8306|nr:SDR family oxidoreductase [Pseudomonadota bacterium]HAR58737.1 short-chain dehydrogenase [Alcanivorax sp.]|tara:strand:- start:146991 stop:147758 length:768 start_codon:yes stop_codon:yes gene_type:complete